MYHMISLVFDVLERAHNIFIKISFFCLYNKLAKRSIFTA